LSGLRIRSLLVDRSAFANRTEVTITLVGDPPYRGGWVGLGVLAGWDDLFHGTVKDVVCYTV
jgi:hypothetical protein